MKSEPSNTGAEWAKKAAGAGPDDRVKVLYVAGWGRSGSTILDNLLGQIDGFFSVGEINCIWERNFLGEWLCGCGEPFRECSIWTEVVKTAFGNMGGVDARNMIRLRDSGARTRHVPLMLAPLGKTLLRRRLGSYLDNLAKLYRGIRSTTGSKVIVDSSKSPTYGYALNCVPDVDLCVLHLVRDPRAVAYSWQRKKKIDPQMDELMIRYGPFQSAVVWNVWNLLTEIFWNWGTGRYLRVRYEDLMSDPQTTLGHVLDLVDGDDLVSSIEGRKVKIERTHTTSGNLSRFKTGTIELRPDEEWRVNMRAWDKKIVGVLTWPLRRRYGYTDETS